MCQREIRTYIDQRGAERRVEEIKYCRRARDNQTCNDVQRTEYMPARLEERRPDDINDIIGRTDKHGREVTWRRVTRQDEKRPVRPVSPSLPRAPTPPRPHKHRLSSDICPRPDCPLSPGRETLSPASTYRMPETRSTSSSGSRIKTTITVPAYTEYSVPTLASPPPGSHRKILKSVHRRHDSAKGFSSRSPSDPMEGPSRPRRAHFEESNIDRPLQIELARLEQDEARRAQAQIAEDARLARLEQDRYDQRATARAQSAEAARQRDAERQRETERALEDARRRALRTQQDDEYNRRLDAERRAMDEERRQSEQRSRGESSRQQSITEPASPRQRPRPILHQETSDTVVRTAHGRNASEDIIIREQLRMAREERQATRPAADDYLGASLDIDEEFPLSRRERMRRYKDDASRRWN